MDFIYHQVTGEMYAAHGADAPERIGVGHAGNGEGRNKPSFEGVRNTGPLPRHQYTISPEASDPKLGIVAMRLTPIDGTGEMFGRAGFFIHAPEFSEGCIVLDLNVRCVIAEAVRKGKNVLQVV